MARLALAASLLLSLFLLSTAHRFPSDLPIEAAELGPATSSSDAAAIRLHSDMQSVQSTPKTVEATIASSLFPSDKPSEESVPKPEEVTTETLLPTADSDAGLRAVPIEVSFMPVRRDHPFPRPRVVGRPFWRRLGRHCHHLRCGPYGGFPRGAVIPYGDDMIVPAEQVRRGYEGGRYFSREAHAGGFHHHPMIMEEISVEDLGKQREMGIPREMRPFPRFRPHRHHDEEERGLVRRFLDFLNRH